MQALASVIQQKGKTMTIPTPAQFAAKVPCHAIKDRIVNGHPVVRTCTRKGRHDLHIDAKHNETWRDER